MENFESEETIPNNRRESGVVREEQQTAKEVAESTLCLFKDYFDSRIGRLKRELKEEAASKSDKFSGNKVQFEFNSDIDHEISRIKRATESRNHDKIKDICYDLKDKIHKRNKCIKIADKSPAGWGTVKEYLSDDLASDTDDEKRIRSAESRALRAKKNREQDRIKRLFGNSYGSKMPEFPAHYLLPLLLVLLTVIFVPTRKPTLGPKSTDICLWLPDHGSLETKLPEV
ncbi:unnamed protein product [Mytilus coruscus]|uniref:Uncharacterized protein n=1 Tax=Mytilus coruscus TaxID=42192 RepID=A0A6J8CN74_MYTCO|nr:unnamed protein product [Mytilus coruscus]